jgi:DNA-binding NtrC family response regulator
MPKILIIEDDKAIAEVLRLFLESQGIEVTLVHSGDRGLALVKEERFDLVLTDIVMPCGISGMDILREVSGSKRDIPVIIITGFATVETAVEAMKLGAFDYITKPFNSDELLLTIKRAISMRELKEENVMLRKQLKREYSFNGLIGISPTMQRVYEMIEKVADTDCTILITGESGTGKEVIAKTIHYNSSRSQKPFIPLNCAAIPTSLLESELFGYEKGAFTGAINTRIGRFELANNGTLFLDEIGDLDPSLQAKLLRVIQEKEFERVGGIKTIKVDTRIIAATNRNLEELVRQERFREDLYYRLNVVQLHLPPLRERREDIPLLLDHFVNEFSTKMKREPLRFSEEVMECFLSYNWPGNVRELKNLLEGLMVLAKDRVIKLEDLPERFFNSSNNQGIMLNHNRQAIDIPDEGIDLEKTLYHTEKTLILKALKKAGGTKSKAAKLLGIKRTTLIEKLKRIGIESESADG